MADFFAPVNANVAEQMAAQAPAGDGTGPQGRVIYSIQNQNGDQAKIGDQDLLQQLHEAGHNPTGLSSDAQLVSFQDRHGQYQVPMQQVLQKLGWQVTARDFKDSDRSQVNPALTFAINTPSLQDDSAKQAYLTNYLQHHGIDHPQVVGQGDDWHAFDPTTGKYTALTKGQGLGVDDLAKYGAKAPSFLGSVLGGGLGTSAGPVGTVGGSVAGGFVGARAADALGAAVDPEAYAQALSKQGFQQTATNWAKDAGLDAIGGLGAAGIAHAFPGAAAKGVASRALAGAGSVAEGAGEGVSHLAGAIKGGMPQDILMAATDPTGMSVAGDLMQAPAQAIKGGAGLYNKGVPAIGRGLQAIGSHPLAEELAPNLAEKVHDLGWSMGLHHAPVETDTAEAALRHTPFGGVGKFADSAEKLGQAVVAPVRGAYSAGANILQGAGRLAQGGGAAARAIGKAVGPYETNVAAHMGSEELRARLLKRQRDLQMQGLNRTLVPDNQLVLEDQPHY